MQGIARKKYGSSSVSTPGPPFPPPPNLVKGGPGVETLLEPHFLVWEFRMVTKLRLRQRIYDFIFSFLSFSPWPTYYFRKRLVTCSFLSDGIPVQGQRIENAYRHSGHSEYNWPYVILSGGILGRNFSSHNIENFLGNLPILIYRWVFLPDATKGFLPNKSIGSVVYRPDILWKIGKILEKIR